jgi:hypothetical protein
MFNISYKLIILSFVLSIGGAVGGWALTNGVAGSQAALSFLRLSVGTVMSIIALQTIFYILGKNRVIHQVLFGVSLGLSLVWFMSCLLLPLFWIDAINNVVKLLIIACFLALCISNAVESSFKFKRKWIEVGQGSFITNFDEVAGTIDWHKVIGPMKLSVTLHIPGLPAIATPVFSAVMILSMLLGLTLRYAFPIFSIFAWGIPASMIISTLVQMMGLGVAQVARLAELEKKIGKHIRPAS